MLRWDGQMKRKRCRGSFGKAASEAEVFLHWELRWSEVLCLQWNSEAEGTCHSTFLCILCSLPRQRETTSTHPPAPSIATLKDFPQYLPQNGAHTHKVRPGKKPSVESLSNSSWWNQSQRSSSQLPSHPPPNVKSSSALLFFSFCFSFL